MKKLLIILGCLFISKNATCFDRCERSMSKEEISFFWQCRGKNIESDKCKETVANNMASLTSACKANNVFDGEKGLDAFTARYIILNQTAAAKMPVTMGPLGKEPLWSACTPDMHTFMTSPKASKNDPKNPAPKFLSDKSELLCIDQACRDLCNIRKIIESKS